MNREIKFRVWNKKKNCLSYPKQFRLGDYSFGWGDSYEELYFGGGDRANSYDGNYIILMQYTGLKDKNGREIYEGDIIEFDFETQNIVECRRDVVKYNDRQCGFDPLCWRVEVEDSYYSIDIDDIEVIGNIYENPELLKS